MACKIHSFEFCNHINTILRIVMLRAIILDQFLTAFNSRPTLSNNRAIIRSVNMNLCLSVLCLVLVMAVTDAVPLPGAEDASNALPAATSTSLGSDMDHEAQRACRHRVRFYSYF